MLPILLFTKIMSMNAQTKVMGANVKLAGAMTTATQSMTAMNKVIKPEQLNKTMQDFGKASAKMDMTEEMMNDALGIFVKNFLNNGDYSLRRFAPISFNRVFRIYS